MAYTKTNWTSTTPINTNNLNKIEDGISANDTAIETINTNIGNLSDLTTPTKGSLVGAINSIVESGSNDNGEYIKYSDGTMICTSTRSFSNVAVTTTWGTLYDSPALNLESFPHTFIEIPKVFITSHNTANSNSKACFIEWVSNTTNSVWGQTAVSRPTSGTVNLTFDLLAIGKWK